jgi:hypothetical protein
MTATAATSATGPRTPQGKAISSRNAIRHGLTAVSPVLPSEDQAEYDLFQADIVTRYDPQDAEETAMVTGYVDTLWRLRRIPVHESRLVILEMKRVQSNDSTLDAISLEVLALDRLSQSRTLANLHRQEQRLNAKLKSLQPALDRIMTSSKVRYLEHLRQAKAAQDSKMREQQNELVAEPQQATLNDELQATRTRIHSLLQRVA